MKISTDNLAIIREELEAITPVNGERDVDIHALSDRLGVQYNEAKRILYHAAKKLGYEPTRTSIVRGSPGKTWKDDMLAAVEAVLAK